MVETAEAMANLDAIAATPGLDGIYVGPADLTFSLFEGRLAPGFDREEPEMIEALKRILAACQTAGIRAALHCGTAEYAARAIGWGFNMTTVSGDSRLLAAAAGASVARFRELMETAPQPAGCRWRARGLLMPHVLVAGRLHPSGIALLQSHPDVTFDYVEEVSEPSYASLIAKADGLVLRTQPLSAATVGKAGRLRIVSRHGVGYDSVDLPALNDRGIILAVVGDVNSVSVAEQAMMLLLAVAKRVLRGDQAIRRGDWGWRNRLEQGELWEKRLLVVGYGRSGRHLARTAAAFGMEVEAFDPYLARQGWPKGHVAPATDLIKGLSSADFVSVHAPKGDKPVIGVVELAAMKPSAILVNTARGGVVDETALISSLQQGRLAGAGLDVFEDEPPAPENPLLAMDQVVLSPHIAGLTTECAERMAVASVQNVLDFFAGRIDPALIINREFANGS